jgi:hypothetical protein
MEKRIFALWLCTLVLWLCTAGLLLLNTRHGNQGVSPVVNNTIERVSAKPLCDQLALEKERIKELALEEEFALEKVRTKEFALEKERTKDVFFDQIAEFALEKEHTKDVFVVDYAFIDYAVIHREILLDEGLNHGWVVAVLDPRMSICKRMTHTLACLAFAMATERALLFDWIEFPDPFGDLFQQPPIAYSYSAALALQNMTHHERSYKTSVNTAVDMAFFNSLSDVHLNETYPEEVVYLHGDALWAPPLFAVKVYSVVQSSRGTNWVLFFDRICIF